MPDPITCLKAAQVLIQDCAWIASRCEIRILAWYLSVCVVGLRAQALPLNLNILMLYDNMEQMKKLHMSIFDQLVWTNCSKKFVIENIIDASKFSEYF